MLAGRDVILANQFLLAFPPYSTFAGKIFLYDELNRRIFLFCENSVLLSLAFCAVMIPISALSLPAAVLAFLLRAGHYKRLYQRKIAEDIAFCKTHETP
jgi:hypothetical protein